MVAIGTEKEFSRRLHDFGQRNRRSGPRVDDLDLTSTPGFPLSESHVPAVRGPTRLECKSRTRCQALHGSAFDWQTPDGPLVGKHDIPSRWGQSGMNGPNRPP